MERKNSKDQKQVTSERTRELRSENAKREKRDSRGRFTASTQSKVQNQKTGKKDNDQIVGIIIEEEYGCGC